MRITFNIYRLMIFVIILLLLNLFINPASSQTAGDWVEKGIAYGKQGEYNKAIEAFDKAIAINPNSKETWYNKGKAFDNLGEYEKAVEAYDRATAIDPNFKEAWNNKGIALSRLGEDDKAIDAFDKVIAIDPNDKYAKRSRDFTKIKNWIIIGGLAFFIVIGIIVLIKYKRNSNSKNVNPDYKINKWKILGYVVITWFALLFLAGVIAEYRPYDPMALMDAQSFVWAWYSVFLGIIMAYKLKKKRELIYGALFLYIAYIPIGVFIVLAYFIRSYYKLEKQKLGSSSGVEKQEGGKLWNHFKGSGKP